MKPSLFTVALLLSARMLVADDAPAAPDQGYAGERYTALWTKSPFSIETPEAPTASADYQFVGVAQFDGVTYVSLIDKSNNEHFVLSSDKPTRNLSLVSATHSAGGTSAIVQRAGGERLTLQMEVAAAPPPVVMPAAGPMQINAPPANTLPLTSAAPVGGGQLLVPSPNPSVGGMVPAAPPIVRFHHRVPRIPLPPPSQ